MGEGNKRERSDPGGGAGVVGNQKPKHRRRLGVEFFMVSVSISNQLGFVGVETTLLVERTQIASHSQTSSFSSRSAVSGKPS